MAILPTLALVFVVLKLVGVVDWSWWLVVSPLYPAVLFYLGCFVFIGFSACACKALDQVQAEKRKARR